MLVFAHTGLTLGLGLLLADFTRARRSTTNREEGGAVARSEPSNATAASPDCSRTHKVSRLQALVGYGDLRLMLIGSLLPDIIDKPVGQLLFRQTFSNGRIFSHSLLFLLVITIIGLFLYRCGKRTWFLMLFFGTFTHLILDQMWLNPQTLLWPAYGFSFPKTDLANWLPERVHALLTNSQIYMPELAGAAILAWFAWLLLRRRSVLSFLKYGKVR